MVDLGVRIGSLHLNNPVMPGSGTFAEGLAQVIAFERLGALVIKTFTEELRDGNPTPRVAEVANGMLNSIGIPSRGVDHFINTTLPFYSRFETPLIVSVAAPTPQGFYDIVRRIDLPGVAGIEANISCPNVDDEGQAFAMHPRTTAQVVERLRKATTKPLWIKLTPNTNDVAEIARAAEGAGADALVVTNTYLAMAIDVETFRPKLGSLMGGLSGPAIKPISLRMAYQCAQAVKIPIIGSGGIASAEDAVEFMLAGATAVQVGTASFVRPTALIDIIDGLAAFCVRKGIQRVAALTGALVKEDAGVMRLAPAP